MSFVTGRTQGIENLLNAIGLPKHTRSFKIECDANSVMEISCTYYPEDSRLIDEEGELITFFKKYNLVEKKE